MNAKVYRADPNDHDAVAAALLAKLRDQDAEAHALPAVVLDPELVERIRIYDARVHDMSTSEDRSFLVNHFVAIGLKHAEAERDTQTGDLF